MWRDSKVICKGSYRCPWKHISHGLVSFLNHIRLEVGDGIKIRFWEDKWKGGDAFASLFPRIYRLSLNKGKSVASLASLNSDHIASWKISFVRNFNERELVFLSLMKSIEGVR